MTILEWRSKASRKQVVQICSLDPGLTGSAVENRRDDGLGVA
jgi:hypothetical protein